MLPRKVAIFATPCRRNARTVKQYLVQWTFLPPELATWEEERDLHRHFPNFPARGQAGFHVTDSRGGMGSNSFVRPLALYLGLARCCNRRGHYKLVASRRVRTSWKKTLNRFLNPISILLLPRSSVLLLPRIRSELLLSAIIVLLSGEYVTKPPRTVCSIETGGDPRS